MSSKNEKKKWSSSDETSLLKLISEDKPMEKITKKLKRKEKDIVHRLKKIAVKLANEKKSQEDIKKTLKFLTDEQIKKISDSVNKKISNKIELGTKSEEFSELGLNKVSKQKTTKSSVGKDAGVINDETQKMYTLLNEINKKIDLIIENQTKVNIGVKNNLSSGSSSESSSNSPVPQAPAKKDGSSSFITEGSDTQDVLNLIQNRTEQVNAIRSKYMGGTQGTQN